MKRLLVVSLILAMVGIGIPVQVAAAGQQPNGAISGLVRNSSQQPVANTTVRLRNTATGQVAGTSTTNALGAFTFSGVPLGSYVVEVVNAAGVVIGSSSTVALTAGATTVSGVAITLAGAKAATGAAAAGGGSFFTSTAGIIVLVAAGAGIGVAIYEGTKSSSK